MELARQIESLYGQYIGVDNVYYVVSALQRTTSIVDQLKLIFKTIREVELLPHSITRFRKGKGYPLPVPAKRLSGLYRFIDRVYGDLVRNFYENIGMINTDDRDIAYLAPNNIILRLNFSTKLYDKVQILFLRLCALQLTKVVANYSYNKFATDWKSNVYVANVPAKTTPTYVNSRYLDYVRKYHAIVQGIPTTDQATIGSIALDRIKPKFLDLMSYLVDPDILQQNSKYYVRYSETSLTGTKLNTLIYSIWNDLNNVIVAYTYGLAMTYKAFMESFVKMEDLATLSSIVESISYEMDRLVDKFGLYNRLVDFWMRSKFTAKLE